MPRPVHRRCARVAPGRGRARELAPIALALAAGLLIVRAAWPAPANAADLFPVDDWLGAGIKKAGDVALGPLKLGVKEIAGLLAAIVGALADLLVPKSLVKAGLGGIKWLVQLPPVGADATPEPGVPAVRMPHLQELRDTMTWIGVTLLPLGIVISAGRAFLAPTADGDSPADVLARAVTAGIALLLYDWAWGVVTELSHLLTSGLLGLPWVADGVERMLETLVIGGATGSAVAAEFVVPLMILIAGTVLLGLLLVRVGLEVATALLYVLGGLILGLSVTNLGRRLLSGWLIAATAIAALPLLWSTVFAVGAALMLDAGDTAGRGGFAEFVAQLYNVAAALAVFWIAIKLALGVFRHAGGAITGLTTSPAGVGAGGAGRGAGAGGAARLAALAQNATPAGLARFSKAMRGHAQGAAAGLAAGARYPVRHPVRTAQAASYPVRRPVQATREAAGSLAEAISATAGGTASTARGAGERAGGWYRDERDGGRFSRLAADKRVHAAGNGRGTAPADGSAVRTPSARAAAAVPVARAPSATARSVAPPPPGPVPPPPAASADGSARLSGVSEREPGPAAEAPRPTGRGRPETTRPLWLPRRARKSDDRDRKGKGK